MGLLGWAFVGGVSVVAACGGSSNDGGNEGAAGKAGSAGASGSSAGSPNGGSASGGTASGGSRAGGGTSSAGTAAGGRNVGGSPGTGGFNMGGEGFDPSDFACETPPEVGAACGADAVPCVNGTEVCYCNMSKWACMSALGGGGAGGTGPIGDVECPASKPTSGTACGASVGFCPYGEGAFSGCACYNGSWACL